MIRPDAVSVYVRWSTEEQGEGTTLQEQLERCKSYVVSQGWAVNERLIFIDDGYSGATLHRPALTALRELIRAGQVDCVVSLKIDRLSRSLVDCVELVLREWAGTCHYKSVSQPINTTDELSRVFFAILAGFAEYERALIRERTFSGLLRRVREGSIWGAGKAPYGYARVGKGRLAVSETEAAVVRLIFQLAGASGLGPSAIAARLNGEGIPGPGGKGWWAPTVRNLLDNRIYAGYPDYGRRYVDHGPSAQAGRRVLRWRAEPLVAATAAVPALVIVSEAVFAVAQARSERTHGFPPPRSSPHLLTGIARCRCGGPLITGYDARARRFYYCQRRDRSRGGGTCTAGGGFLYADQVEPIVTAELVGRTLDREALVDLAGRHWAQERSDATAASQTRRRLLTGLGARERRLAVDRTRILRRARRGEIALEEQRAFERDLEAEARQIADQRAALTGSVSLPGTPDPDLFRTWCKQTDPWAAVPPSVQREVLAHMVEHLVLYKPKGRGQLPELDIHWRT